MTIGEMEQRSGMSRANIRFYESEGLLSPERSANGYRDYSAEDLETLQRIKLLRALQIPLEEIRQLQKGEAVLPAVLTRQLSVLDGQKTAAERACRLCRTIRDDGVDFAALDAEKYLALPECTEENTAAALSDDRAPAVRSPWRRFFARLLDLQLCQFTWDIVLWLCGTNLLQLTTAVQWVGIVVILAMMLLIEPLLLHWWGTTPGKWIMGLSVTDPDGGRLNVESARNRTLSALWHGMGAYLPIYDLIRLVKSYRSCADGETLPWEEDSQLVLKDRKRWRFAAMAGSWLIIISLLVLMVMLAERPYHRGDISAAEFADNFNRLVRYHEIDFPDKLDENGHWVSPEHPGATIIVTDAKHPDFALVEKAGVLQSVGFTLEIKDSTMFVSSFQNEMQLAAMAFPGATQEFGPISARLQELRNTIREHPFEDYRYAGGGFTVEYHVDYDGYYPVGKTEAVLIPLEGATTYCTAEFSITKEGG